MRSKMWGPLGVALWCSAWGCGEEVTEPPPDPACTEIGLPAEITVPTDQEAPLQGSITLSDRRDRSLDDQGVPRTINRGLIQAAFADVSTSTDAPENLLPIGANCIGRLSRSSVDSPAFLEMDGVTVRNTARGDVVTNKIGTGRYTQAGDLILLGANGVRVVGTAAAGAPFTSFDEAAEPIESLEVSSPASDGQQLLKVDDLPIRWSGTGGQGVLITVIPNYTGNTQSGGQVLCQVIDDGCFNLPSAATNFLLANREDGMGIPSYTLVVERYKIRVVEPAARTLLTIESSSEYRLTLKNGVE
ncbi:MAG: hypothetical protein IPG45_06290 [Deltaproteobacteria bacterium]|nr:hypothetical protein [Deltaproteobacteria bacterium]